MVDIAFNITYHGFLPHPAEYNEIIRCMAGTQSGLDGRRCGMTNHVDLRCLDLAVLRSRETRAIRAGREAASMVYPSLVMGLGRQLSENMGVSCITANRVSVGTAFIGMLNRDRILGTTISTESKGVTVEGVLRPRGSHYGSNTSWTWRAIAALDNFFASELFVPAGEEPTGLIRSYTKDELDTLEAGVRGCTSGDMSMFQSWAVATIATIRDRPRDMHNGRRYSEVSEVIDSVRTRGQEPPAPPQRYIRWVEKTARVGENFEKWLLDQHKLLKRPLRAGKMFARIKSSLTMFYVTPVPTLTRVQIVPDRSRVQMYASIMIVTGLDKVAHPLDTLDDGEMAPGVAEVLARRPERKAGECTAEFMPGCREPIGPRLLC